VVGEQAEIIRIAEPDVHSNENSVYVNYTIFETDNTLGRFNIIKEQHRMRHLSLPEIDLLASASGLKRLVAEEFLTGTPCSETTWSVCVVLQKI
jgi:hypothetical protein